MVQAGCCPPPESASFCYSKCGRGIPPGLSRRTTASSHPSGRQGDLASLMGNREQRAPLLPQSHAGLLTLLCPAWPGEGQCILRKLWALLFHPAFGAAVCLISDGRVALLRSWVWTSKTMMPVPLPVSPVFVSGQSRLVWADLALLPSEDEARGLNQSVGVHSVQLFHLIYISKIMWSAYSSEFTSLFFFFFFYCRSTSISHTCQAGAYT